MQTSNNALQPSTSAEDTINRSLDLDAMNRLLQTLSNIVLEINALQAVAQDGTPDLGVLRGGLALIEQAARSAVQEIRAASDDLPVPELIGVTLTEALAHLIDETGESLGLSSRVTISGEEHPLPPTIARVLYRLVQESLYQIQRRGNARKLRFSFHYGRDEAIVSIEDDGDAQAIMPETPIPHFAFADTFSSKEAISRPLASPFEREDDKGRDNIGPYVSLRHRLEHLGGTLEATALPEGGTRVQAHAPYVLPIQDKDRQGTNRDEMGMLETDGDGMSATKIGGDGADAINRPLRILIVDGQAVPRAGLRRLLESYPGFQVVGEAADGVQAVSEALELGPQVVIMDALLPNGQSIEALKQIKQVNPDARVLLLSAQEREDALYEALRAGADGYLLKDVAPDELAQAVRVVASGEALVHPRLASKLLSRVGKQGRAYPADALTPREREVLQLLARGMRNKEIAARLVVSERTINFHLAHIYQKLNVSGRTEALSRALEQGLISSGRA
jgi:DNA-binding NarL/FixJ family response regulator